MEPEQGRSSQQDASRLSRRQYLLTAGALGSGVIAVGSRDGGASTTGDVDATGPTVDHDWTTVELSGSYDDPVVVAPALSYHGTNPASPRVRDVAREGFDLAVEEWRYLDGVHLRETVGCFVADAGAHDPPDGPAFEVGGVGTDHHWTSMSFSAGFDETPVVLSTTQTENGRQPVVTRNRNVDASGMELRLQEEENEGPHLRERIGYLATASGTGSIDGKPCEAGRADGVTGNWQSLSFSNGYEKPVFLADMQTYRGSNTATVRYRNLTGSGVEVKVEEERSLDRETAHLGEQVGYLVVEGDPDTGDGYGMAGFGEGGYGE